MKIGTGGVKKTYDDFRIENSSPEELKVLAEKIDDRLFGVEQTHQDAKKVVMAGDIWEQAREISKDYGLYKGLYLGYPKIADVMGSFLPGELMVLAGPPGKGKSLFAQNVTFNVVKKGKPVAFISLEMPTEQTLSRMQLMCQNEEEEQNLKTLLWFQDKTTMTDEEVAIFMAEAKKMGAELVVIDYLQFIPKSSNNERGEIARFVRRFKEQANKYKIPVILISSINRAVEKGQRPTLSNLSESSVIEFTADMVAFVWRESGEDVMEFYMEKNRSRKLVSGSVYLQQDKWELTETTEPVGDPFGELK